MKNLLLIILPIVIFGTMIYLINNGTLFTERGTPLPQLSFEKVEFIDEPRLVVIYVRNISQDKLTIAQVDINDRPSSSIIKPSPILNRLEGAEIKVYYPWINNVPYQIGITTSDGVRFTFDVDAATPKVMGEVDLLYYSLIGLYVGVIPVALGFTWLPFIKRSESKWYEFFLSLTIGLLAFLAISAILEAFQLTNEFTILNGNILIFTTVISTFLILMILKINRLANKNLIYLSYIIALGIGLHNMGEGLAIGASTAIGSLALSRFLIIGFTIHNTTEGFAIVSPLSKTRVRIIDLILLGLIAGVPTIIGAWIGAVINIPLASLIFLSIGAGAIFQVIYVVYAWLKSKGHDIISSRSIIGFILGMVIMHLTSLLVT